MREMFNGNTGFNQNIGGWNVSNVTNFLNFMASRSPANYSAANLNAIYNGWSSRPVQPNLNITFGSIKYTAEAQVGKNILDFAPNNWTIVDGGI
jgi:surface protein